jgi:integrase
MRELRAWKVQQSKDRLALGPEWQDHGFVFTTEVGSPLDGSNLYRTPFRNLMARAGLGT